jgi:hypothetical protein
MGYFKLKYKLAEASKKSRKKALEHFKIADKAEYAIEIIDWHEAVQSLGEQNNIQNQGASLHESFSLKKIDTVNTLLDNEQPYIEDTIFHMDSLIDSLSGTSNVASLAYYPVMGGNENLIKIYESFPKINNIEIQNELDQHLKDLFGNDELVEKRKGAWATFNMDTPASISQACYSMRDILTNILDKFCEVDEVKKASWWKEVKKTTFGVSKKQKIKYFLVGVEDFPAKEDIEEFERRVEFTYKTHGKLIEAAKDKPLPRSAARLLLNQYEDEILHLFRLRERIASRRKDKLNHL